MCSLISYIDLKFITSSGIEKGWVTKMWNRAFKMAYDDGCDYFYQCGDDMQFKTKGWINDLHCLEYCTHAPPKRGTDWETFEMGPALPFKVPGDTILDQNIQVLGLYRLL